MVSGMSMLYLASMRFVKRLTPIAPINISRYTQEAFGRGRLKRMQNAPEITHENIHDITLVHARPVECKDGSAILYLHGGGYTAGGISYVEMAASIVADSLKTEVCGVVYRLAPEYKYPCALIDAYNAYSELRKRFAAKDISLVGDSAGGGLIFALALYLKELGEEQPCMLIGISPWVNLTMSGDSYRKNWRSDPFIVKQTLIRNVDMYIGDNNTSTREPFISPLFGDLTGLPPTLIMSGSAEILLSDSQSMHEKLKRCGCTSKIMVFENMWHVFPFYGTVEAEQAMDLMCRYYDEQRAKAANEK